MPIFAVAICCCKSSVFSGNGDISRYVAEAKFFRAYSYFDLVQLFGDVIITKEPLDITSPELRMSRNDRSEVIDFVIQDLKDAAEVLPEIIATDEEGRISKWGAYAFLSRVALYEGTWQQNRNNEERGKALLSIAADAAKKLSTVSNSSYSNQQHWERWLINTCSF